MMPSDDEPTGIALDRLIVDARHGLWSDPPRLPARWFYDDVGSRLFDEITRLPEYYPTRAETEILTEHSADVAGLTEATTLIELGSGTSTKTRLLLTALTASGRRIRFVPIDVSGSTLEDAAQTIERRHPTVQVTPVVADFADSLGELPGEPGRRLLIFLGSTIGNLEVAERRRFLERLRKAFAPGDHFLLGADLVKDAGRLVAAYDDEAGVTAAFNRNLVTVLGRELKATGLRPDDFGHVATWNSAQSRIEMRLRARRPIRAYFAVLEKEWRLEGGEEILTEISTKFRLADLRAELAEHRLEAIRVWTDAAGDFSLTLCRAT
jgi:L-histidine Nalpha-methyltransferase